MAAASGNFSHFEHVENQDRLAVIDLSCLQAQTFGNAALEVEMLELFLRQSAQLLLAFNESKAAKDWRDCARALKSSAQSIGAMQVAHLAARIESCSLMKNRDAAGLLLDALEEAVLLTNEKIRAHLKTLQFAH